MTDAEVHILHLCQCDCHKSPRTTTHITACCEKCPFCHRNVRRGMLGRHKVFCPMRSKESGFMDKPLNRTVEVYDEFFKKPNDLIA